MAKVANIVVMVITARVLVYKPIIFVANVNPITAATPTAVCGRSPAVTVMLQFPSKLYRILERLH